VGEGKGCTGWVTERKGRGEKRNEGSGRVGARRMRRAEAARGRSHGIGRQKKQDTPRHEYEKRARKAGRNAPRPTRKTGRPSQGQAPQEEGERHARPRKASAKPTTAGRRTKFRNQGKRQVQKQTPNQGQKGRSHTRNTCGRIPRTKSRPGH